MPGIKLVNTIEANSIEEYIKVLDKFGKDVTKMKIKDEDGRELAPEEIKNILNKKMENEE